MRSAVRAAAGLDYLDRRRLDGCVPSLAGRLAGESPSCIVGPAERITAFCRHVREARGDYPGARWAYLRTLHYRKGHSAALFQMGLMEEQRHNSDQAVAYYAKAFQINPTLLDVRVNPRILDSKLIGLAMLKMYPTQHAKESTQFEPTPGDYGQRNLPDQPVAPSPQAPATQIVTPSAPVTNPATQAPPPKPPL